MEPTINRHKGLLISAWIVSVVTLVITAPFAFIAGIFTGDNTSGDTLPIAYAVILSPLVFLVLPTIAQITYKRMKYEASKWLSIAALTACVLIVGGLLVLITR